MEAVLAMRDQPNLPGTVRKHPNWLRRLPVDLEDLAANKTLRSIVRLMQAEGRGLKTPAEV
jgi:4-alpha-glucanotransferase